MAKSQREAIEKHLRAKGSITSFEAFDRYGITRLSAIIFNIRRNKEMQIRSVSRKKVNRYGNTVNFSEYTLIEEEESDV